MIAVRVPDDDTPRPVLTERLPRDPVVLSGPVLGVAAPSGTVGNGFDHVDALDSLGVGRVLLKVTVSHSLSGEKGVKVGPWTCR